jgi:hypothetical protein
MKNINIINNQNHNNNNNNSNNHNNNNNIQNNNNNQKTQIFINKVSNRFLPLCPSVKCGLEPEPKVSDFHFIKELGSGSFGRVMLVMHKKTKCK